MKYSTLVFLAIFTFPTLSVAQTPEQIAFLKAFAKAYGYVKYFHPSDEATEIDWNAFAIYGASQMILAEDRETALATLQSLFRPLAPAARFMSTGEKNTFDLNRIRPPSLDGYALTYWQHEGVEQDINMDYSPYHSVRVNRETTIETSSEFGNLLTTVDPTPYRGQKLKYTAWVRMEAQSRGSGSLWLRMDRADGSRAFFDNMTDRPIRDTVWKQYTITGRVDSTVSTMLLGSMLWGKGKLMVDQAQLFVDSNGEWEEVSLPNPGFENKSIGRKQKGVSWRTEGEGYAFEAEKQEAFQGKKSISISYQGETKTQKGKPLFSYEPAFGELIEKQLGPGIFCQIPLVLYGDARSTYPTGDTKALLALQQKLEMLQNDPQNLALRLGNVINTYNVFQHFYPYFDVVEVDWEARLEEALEWSFQDQTNEDHLATLQKLTAYLQDGHISVSHNSMQRFVPPIAWEWIEDQLVITGVYDEPLSIKPGEVVSQVNGMAAKDFFTGVYARISAGTEGWLHYRANINSLMGSENTELSLRIGEEVHQLRRSQELSAPERKPQQIVHQKLPDNLYYLNLDLIEMDTIRELLPKLEQSEGIICDMRGYPNSNHGLISHLLSTHDTTKGWMQVAQIVYPDQEEIVDFVEYEWLLKSRKPYLGDNKVVFITDGRAISYAESYMGYIEGYQLATIVGQPTAGTNGNVNSFLLPGNYRIRWTGMKVLKHDGSQHHGIGILPHVYVEKTMAGVKAGRDEFLEKAIELAKQR
jgi:C-terminal processing protease CtpA/Prc